MNFTIGPHRIGRDAALFVIAEIGLNHGGRLDVALALVERAAAAGASAVKLQTLKARELVAPDAPAPTHVSHDSLEELFAGFELDESSHAALAGRARELGLAFLSTPLYEGAVALLERVGCDGYKIASGDLTHHDLIALAARTGRPLILSTGMSELDEIAAAIEIARANHARDIALLHCVSLYPAAPDQENLRAIATLARCFDVPVGLSDHSTNPHAAVLTLALGGSLYERHFVLDADHDAIDRAVSMNPDELRGIVASAAMVQRALGSGEKTCGAAERMNLAPSRRGLYARRALPAGHVLRADDLAALRPLAGIAAARGPSLVGRALGRAVAAGAPLVAADFAGVHVTTGGGCGRS